jgi:O-methyltransferase
VRFVEGWFRDTLPAVAGEIGPIAVLRLDGDMYESTIDALTHLEPLVSPGGFVIVDDYNGIEACRQAVTDHRAARGIDAPIHEVDWTAAWWRVPPA